MSQLSQAKYEVIDETAKKIDELKKQLEEQKAKANELERMNKKLVNRVRRQERPAFCQVIKDIWNRVFYPTWFKDQEENRVKKMAKRESSLLNGSSNPVPGSVDPLY